MRKLKKWSCLLLALLMLPALAACGKKQQPDSDASQNEVQDTDTPQDSTPTEEQTKVLVVYFSATGSTKAVAGYIAETLGADTFELTPQEPYRNNQLHVRFPLLLHSGAFHHLSLHILEESIGGTVRCPFTNIVKIKILFHHSICLIYIP